ncbi:hypothetical protein PRIPAC_97731 [Pristionchus pacificus]|uniref:Uncharacterized protein n=1 Tax=Pristionchus pacificus TaxID=54126 RepID=A0A2A6BXE3_PRIPA|nr:hypothetical protein PRIPAC_97731 [Pristionchus pacificus]|eukprot:PDM70672.1 hypothetical protein PRIPAC_43877 [Pristionchus pacificus]
MRRCYTNATDGVILMQSLTVISSDRVSQEIFALSYDLFIVLIILATLLIRFNITSLDEETPAEKRSRNRRGIFDSDSFEECNQECQSIKEIEDDHWTLGAFLRRHGNEDDRSDKWIQTGTVTPPHEKEGRWIESEINVIVHEPDD